MKKLEAGFTIVDKLECIKILKKIEECGRICYQSTHKVTDESYKKFVETIINNGHESVLEHYSFTVSFIVDRGVTHEDVRHRLASFSQESTRYCNYDKDQFGSEIKVIDIRNGINLDTKMKDLSIHLINEILNEWEEAMIDAEKHYLRMIQLGATPQIARGVLPQSTKSKINITANLRQWRLILKQRTSKAAHPQMREVMIPLLYTLQKQIPIVFDDIKVD